MGFLKSILGKDPEEKMKMKKADLNINKLIIIILCILVLLVLLMFIYKVPILEWLRNLPDYTYDEDKEIEAPEIDKLLLEGLCPEGEVVGYIGDFTGTFGFREQYIHFIVQNEEGRKLDVETKLYWRGDEKEAKIWLLQKDNIFETDWGKKDIEIAEVKNGIINVELTLDSEIYQRTRFSNRPKELNLISKFISSYIAGNNKICRKGEEVKLKPAWPESEGGNYIYINPELKLNNGEVEIRGLKEYVNLKASEITFLYLENKRDYIQINGFIPHHWYNILTTHKYDLLRIYPDGSFWYNEYEAIADDYNRVYLSNQILKKTNPYIIYGGKGLIETNLKLNEKLRYEEIRKIVK